MSTIFNFSKLSNIFKIRYVIKLEKLSIYVQWLNRLLNHGRISDTINIIYILYIYIYI